MHLTHISANALTSIPREMCKNDTSLEYVNIANATIINSNAFENCSELTSIQS
jgi:hypothetical protein